MPLIIPLDARYECMNLYRASCCIKCQSITSYSYYPAEKGLQLLQNLVLVLNQLIADIQTCHLSSNKNVKTSSGPRGAAITVYAVHVQ